MGCLSEPGPGHAGLGNARGSGASQQEGAGSAHPAGNRIVKVQLWGIRKGRASPGDQPYISNHRGRHPSLHWRVLITGLLSLSFNPLSCISVENLLGLPSALPIKSKLHLQLPAQGFSPCLFLTSLGHSTLASLSSPIPSFLARLPMPVVTSTSSYLDPAQVMLRMREVFS